MNVPTDEGERWGVLFTKVSSIEKKLDKINGTCDERRKELDTICHDVSLLKSWRNTLGVISGALWAALVAIAVAMLRRD